MTYIFCTSIIQYICILAILGSTLQADATPKVDPSGQLTSSLSPRTLKHSKPGEPEKRERFLGDFAIGFAKFNSGGLGGLGLGGGGFYGHGHHHHQHGFGYGGGFQHGLGLGGYHHHHHGYNPYYYRPAIAGGYLGGSSYGFKQHFHHGYHQHSFGGYPGHFHGGLGLGGGISFH